MPGVLNGGSARSGGAPARAARLLGRPATTGRCTIPPVVDSRRDAWGEAYDAAATLAGWWRWLGVDPSAGQCSVADAIEGARVGVIVAGARGGKSRLFGAAALLRAAVRVDVAHLGAGESAVGLVVAPDVRLAAQVIRYVEGFVVEHEAMRALAVKSRGEFATIDRVTLARPCDDGEEREVVIQSLPATRGGSAVRGRSLVDAYLDECAFFRDENSAVNDAEIYRAILPRLLPGAQIRLGSTPWGQSGLLFDLWRAHHDRPTRAIVAVRAPTLALRDDEWIREIVAQERDRDPDNARREFDAEFLSTAGGAFFPPDVLRAAVDDGRPSCGPEAEPRALGGRVGCGVDFAFRSDSSAIVVAQAGLAGGPVSVSYVAERRPAEGRPLRPSEVVHEFAAIAQAYRAPSLLSDGHYLETVREIVGAHGLDVESAPEGQAGKARTYVAVRQALLAGRLRLPDDPRLLAQLRAVEATPQPGGGLSIGVARRAGQGHGDLVSALVLAVWSLLRDDGEAERFAVPSRWAPSPDACRDEAPTDDDDAPAWV